MKQKMNIIYVLCPAFSTSGGPELLHQLVFNLNRLGRRSKIFYVPNTHLDPVPEEFKKYNTEYVFEIDDKKENLLIVPETNTQYLVEYSNIMKSIWWLSIDNYYESLKFSMPECSALCQVKAILKYIFMNKAFKFNIETPVTYHFVQSEYAFQYLLSKKIKKQNISKLSDYINDDFIIEKNIPSKNKKNIVLYNPAKGYSFTKKIMAAAKDITFVPIENMTRYQVLELFKDAKVYIDFGNHPGKDRLPREAAILGCCVLTSLRGSAKFEEDVPIQKKYKFIDSKKNIPYIVDTIRKCMINYESEIENFEYYRQVIQQEKAIFMKEIKNIFLYNRS